MDLQADQNKLDGKGSTEGSTYCIINASLTLNW